MKKLFIIALILICATSFAQPFTFSYGTGIAPADIATKEFVEQAVGGGGTLLYHGSAIPSDIGGFSTLNDVATSTLTNGVCSSVGTTYALCSKSLTVAGQPGLSVIPAGIALVKVTAMSSGKSIYVRPTLWVRTSAGVVTQIATATEALMTSTKSSKVLYMTLANDTFIDPTDRIYMSMYAKAVGSPAPDLTVYFGGDDDTNLAIPAPSEAFARTNGDSEQDFSANNIYASGSAVIDGFTTLGDAATGIKMKVLTGEAGASEGDQTVITHGLTGDKIISWTSKIAYTTDKGVPPNYTKDVELEYQVYQADLSFIVDLSAANSSLLVGDPITIVVWYKE